jgi:hypothetical protein
MGLCDFDFFAGFVQSAASVLGSGVQERKLCFFVLFGWRKRVTMRERENNKVVILLDLASC